MVMSLDSPDLDRWLECLEGDSLTFLLFGGCRCEYQKKRGRGVLNEFVMKKYVFWRRLCSDSVPSNEV